jgi:hypothetical protein
MAVRRFGPRQAAGTVIEEQSGGNSITPGQLGWVGYAMLARRGPVGVATLCSSKTAFNRRYGSIIKDGTGPDCAEDYYNLANGAGGIVVCRITDGNELQAEMTLYARRTDNFVPMGKLKAKNGGRWGGKEKYVQGTVASIAAITNTTLQIEPAQATNFKVDELKDGYIELVEVANKRYKIISNTAAGLVTVEGDQAMLADHVAAAGSDSLVYYITLGNDSEALSVVVTDGQQNPDTEFGIELYLDGSYVMKWGDLNADPSSPRYWVNIINNDTTNDFVQAVDLWTGSYVPSTRPATFYGKNSAVTATVLTAIIHTFKINSPTGGNPTMALGTTNDNMIPQTITITMSSATAGTAVSDRLGALGAVTLGALFTPTNKYAPPFTITAGATPLVATNTLVIVFRPMKADALIDGFVYPDKVNFKSKKYRIIDNDRNTITVAAGSDMTVEATTGDEFMVVGKVEMVGGRDGNSAVVDATYEAAWNPPTSPFNSIDNQNLGLVKLATPGITSTSVQKAGKNYAETKNQQYRYEIPSNILTEEAAVDYVNTTLGRSDYAVVAFPSQGYVPDPDPIAAQEGRQKLIPLTGAIHGREAAFARDYAGYHKAGAGITATLPRVQKLLTNDRALDEELLNPAGIAVIKKKGGNYVVWGDRTLSLNSNWKWKHQREAMSYYEHVLYENSDWIIFDINDPNSDADAVTALMAFFRPEWQKRALRGNQFTDSCKVKVDDELNTDEVRDAGDKIAEVSLRLADTVERFIIRIGKMGVFESVQ